MEDSTEIRHSDSEDPARISVSRDSEIKTDETNQLLHDFASKSNLVDLIPARSPSLLNKVTDSYSQTKHLEGTKTMK